MKILVTGATGFLGKRLTERLLQEKAFTQVLTTGRNETAGKELSAMGAVFVKGNLENAGFAEELVRNAEIIVHSAALAAPWGKYEDFYNANVLATSHLLEAAQKHNVRRFVHISTPSIYFNGKHRFDIKEDDPLPEKFSNFYAQTKYEAEKLVYQAFAKGLPNLMIRPRAIIGAGDATIMPRLLKARQSGRLRIIGDGETLADLTAVSNVVDAILLGINAKPEALGKAYNITNGEPVKLWEFIDWVLQKLDLPLNRQKMPYSVALVVAGIMEFLAKISKSQHEPPLTKQGIGVLAKSCTLNIDRAKNLLGYVPKQTTEEAAKEFLESWRKNEQV